MSTDVDLATLESIARCLRCGGQAVEGMGRAPGGVDAGEMTGLVVTMLSAVAQDAAALCEGLHDAAMAASESRGSYATTEDVTVTRFDSHGVGP